MSHSQKLPFSVAKFAIECVGKVVKGWAGWAASIEVEDLGSSIARGLEKEVSGNWTSRLCLITKGLGKREEEMEEADELVDTRLWRFKTEHWGTEVCTCDFEEELRKREKGFDGKDILEVEAGDIWGPGRRGGTEQVDWPAPCPTPSMANLATENDSFWL